MADVKKYREVVGSHIYLATCKRPDLCFVVSRLLQHYANPTDEHWVNVKHVLRYLRGTSGYFVSMSKDSSSGASAQPIPYRGTIQHQKKMRARDACELKTFWEIIYFKKAWAQIINGSTRANIL